MISPQDMENSLLIRNMSRNYALKAVNEDVHVKCTGQSNKIILDNLRYIDDCSKNIEVRIPFVPGYNSGQIEKMGYFLSELKHLTKVRSLPYHNYAGSKYRVLGMENTLPEIVLAVVAVAASVNVIRAYGIEVL